MWDVQNVRCWGCRMFRMWNVLDVGCLGYQGCWVFRMWGAGGVRCSGCGIQDVSWDVGCQFIKCHFSVLLTFKSLKENPPVLQIFLETFVYGNIIILIYFKVKLVSLYIIYKLYLLYYIYIYIFIFTCIYIYIYMYTQNIYISVQYNIVQYMYIYMYIFIYMYYICIYREMDIYTG